MTQQSSDADYSDDADIFDQSVTVDIKEALTEVM